MCLIYFYVSSSAQFNLTTISSSVWLCLIDCFELNSFPIYDSSTSGLIFGLSNLISILECIDSAKLTSCSRDCKPQL